MADQYPHIVELSKTTIGGLIAGSQNVKHYGMPERPPYAEIGERLSAIRKAFSDLNEQDWARKHNFRSTTYNNWIKGIRRIPVEHAEMFCDLYGLDLDFIYRGKRDGLSENARKLL